MTAIFNSAKHARGFKAALDGVVYDLFLLPGFTENLDPKAIQAVQNHPLFKKGLEDGIFRVIGNVEIVGEKEGQKLTDDKEFGEELVVNDHEEVKSVNKYVPTIDLLKSFQGVGDATARKILGMMPDGGWESRKAFKEATAHLEIDWSASNKKVSAI